MVDSKYDKKQIWFWWILATSIGELVGFAIPAATGPLANLIATKYFGAFPQWFALIIAAVAGSGEGAVLGFAQSLVLRRIFDGFAGKKYIIATAIAAALAWIIGMSSGDIFQGNLSIILKVSIGIVFGIFFLLSIGFAQWIVLRHYIKKASWWILANAVAWPIGVAVPVVGISLVPNSSPIFVFIVAGIVSGYVMGVVVGAITGYTLVRLLRFNGGS